MKWLSGAFIRIFFGLELLFVAPGASAQSIPLPTGWFSPCYDGKALRFAARFDGDEEVVQSADGRVAALQGTNKDDACGKNRSSAIPPDIRLGMVDIQYDGGDFGERMAQIVEDPLTPGNRVMQFWLQRANVRGHDHKRLKGRVQMNVYENQGVKRVRMSVRMFLHPDFSQVLSYPGKMDWLTVSEWWNNAGWTNEKYPFRISVNIFKDEVSGASAQLFFKVHAQTLDMGKRRWGRPAWESINRDFAIPIGKWVTLEYSFDEGDHETGRFFMAATPEGGGRKVIFDVHGYTHHPEDPAPDGLSHWNPIKLYTSRQLIDHVSAQGGALQILWDDLKFAACPERAGAGGDPCSIP